MEKGMEKIMWQYRIEIKNQDFEAIETSLPQSLSEEFRSFVVRANGAMPIEKTIEMGGEFYTFKNVLNFNLEGECSFMTFYGLLKDRGVLDENEIPFGSDGCGGYYLLDLVSQKVVFLDLQSEKKIPLLVFEKFIAKLEK